MGVSGLWSIVADAATAIPDSRLAAEVSGKRLAVDASIWMYQLHLAHRGGSEAAARRLVLRGLLRRVLKLLFWGVRPLLVFDGQPPAIKRRVLEARRRLRTDADERQAAVVRRRLAMRIHEILARGEIKPRAEKEAKPASIVDDWEELGAEEEEGEDLLFLDPDSPQFRALPEEARQEILVAQREALLASSAAAQATEADAAAFSQRQVATIVQRRQLGVRLERLRDAAEPGNVRLDLDRIYKSSPDALAQLPSKRIASSATRRYLLLKEDEHVSPSQSTTAAPSAQISNLPPADVSFDDLFGAEPKAKRAAPLTITEGGVENAQRADAVLSTDETIVQSGYNTCYKSVDTETELEISEPHPLPRIEHEPEALGNKQEMPDATALIDDVDQSNDAPSSDQSKGSPASDAVVLQADDSQLPCMYGRKRSLPLDTVESGANIDYQPTVVSVNTESDSSRAFIQAIDKTIKLDVGVTQHIHELTDTQLQLSHVTSTEQLSNLTTDTLEPIVEESGESDETEVVEQMRPELNDNVTDLTEPYMQPHELLDSDQFSIPDDEQRSALPKQPRLRQLTLFDKGRSVVQDAAVDVLPPAPLGSTPDEELAAEFRTLLVLLGVPWTVAPGEAEAQCVAFEAAGIVDGVVSDDSDTLVFGGRAVYRHFFGGAKTSAAHTVSLVTAEAVQRCCGLDRDALVCIAGLVGSDYAVGVRGIGPTRAIRIVRALQAAESISTQQAEPLLVRALVGIANGFRGLPSDSALEWAAKHCGVGSEEDARAAAAEIADAYESPRVFAPDEHPDFSWRGVLLREAELHAFVTGPRMGVSEIDYRALIDPVLSGAPRLRDM